MNPPARSRARAAVTAAAVTAAVLAPTGPPAAAAGYVTGHHTLPTGRSYYLHMPQPPGPPRPLVVALHGASQTAAAFQTQSGLTGHSDGNGYTLAYGETLGGGWNAGPVCCYTTTDDVAYLRQVVAHAARVTPVDPARVYVVGWSNGGMMALRAGCEAPDVFRGVGVVAGALLVPCPGGADVIHVHGPADTTVPYFGGRGFEGRVFPPVWDEPLRMPPGALHVSVAAPGGHVWPSDAAGRVWAFLAALPARG